MLIHIVDGSSVVPKQITGGRRSRVIQCTCQRINSVFPFKTFPSFSIETTVIFVPPKNLDTINLTGGISALMDTIKSAILRQDSIRREIRKIRQQKRKQGVSISEVLSVPNSANP